MSRYFRPASLSEGLALLNKNNILVAGATDVYPAQTSAHAWGKPRADGWLDISAISELRGIERGDSHWRIGALSTWSDLIAADLPPCFAGLVAAAHEVGGAQIQNRATLVGNLCNASPAADGIPPLLCLNAQVEIRSATAQRSLALSEFVLGNRETALQADEMVTHIIVPDTDLRAVGYFRKLGARKYLVISIVMLAAVYEIDEHNRLRDIRICVGACSSVAQRLLELEAELVGCSISAELHTRVLPQHLHALTPIDDVRADAGYRHAAALEMVKQLMQYIADNPGEKSSLAVGGAA